MCSNRSFRFLFSVTYRYIIKLKGEHISCITLCNVLTSETSDIHGMFFLILHNTRVTYYLIKWLYMYFSFECFTQGSILTPFLREHFNMC